MSLIQRHTLQPFFHADDTGCGCGYDHHNHEDNHAHEHEHDHDSCGCGHDHHAHDHGHDSCGCGHDHHGHEDGHTHEHDHSHGSCGCGHDHHAHEDGHSHEHGHDTPASRHAHTSARGKTVYILENLGCAHCAARMEEKINALGGVKSATITYATKQLLLEAKHPDALLPEIQRICSSIESQVVVKKREPAGRGKVQGNHEKEKRAERLELFLLLVGAALFAAGEIMEHTGVSETASLPVFVIGYLILGGPVLLEAARNISHGQIFDENFLMGLATLAAFAIRDYPEAVGVMLFYRVGEYFEHRAVERSRSQIMEAVDLRPETVSLVSGHDVRIIPAGEAVPGDILLIHPGDRIPLDGVIVEGSSRLDTSPITGEPVPVAVGEGDEVTSGCVNTSGLLKLRVEKPLSESMVTRILDSVENAAASKPKIDRFITRFARIYTPCVVLGAAAIAVLPPLVTGNWHYWIYTAITFLVMSCPCALVLSVPLAYFSGIGAGSRRGILFKGGVSIEALGSVKSVVMDKTGTITEGNFRLQNVIPAGTLSEDDLLRICASCEQNSTHPIAASIVTAAKEKGLALDTPDSLEEIAGHGISAALSGKRILCGNRKLMERCHVEMEHSAMNDTHGAEVFLAVDGTLAGRLVISDTIKADAKSAVQRLRAQGLHTVMLTGDSEEGANFVARETGIDEVHAKLLPQDKLEILKQVRSHRGSVLFVGDGINDAPVLAGADVGAAMGSGADAAIEAADAVFMQASVEAIPDSISIARSVGRIAMQNVVFALAVKLLVMLLGLAGHANMWMAVFADSGVAMLCVLNSIRILYTKR